MENHQKKARDIIYQQITIIGNLGADPEMKYTPSGVPVTNFSVATSKIWNDADGVKQEKTVWFRVTTWRKQAETCAQYLKKGSKVMVVGEIEEARAFTDRDGNNRASLEVTAYTVKFLSGNNNQDAGDSGSGHSGPSASASSQAPARPPRNDDDIPF